MLDRAKHIVMLNKGYPPWVGGIERHVCDISEALVLRGWRVTVLVCNTGNYDTTEETHGVRIIRMRSQGQVFSLPLTRGYGRKLKELQADLVHVHVPFPLAWSAIRKIDSRIPVVCTWHSDIVRQEFLRPLYKTLEQRFLKRCVKILPTSENLMYSSKALQAHHDRCEVIPLALPKDNSLNEEWLAQEALELKKKFDQPIILFVGRLVSYKGLPFLIKAMKKVDGLLLIAGQGPERETLVRLIQKHDLSAKVKLLGHVSIEEKEVLYRTADLFVLPSIRRNEAFGYVLLEAMSNACPVITTNLSTGVQYVNQHDSTGYVVEVKNENALAEAIQQLLNQDELRQQFGQSAKERVETFFNFEATIDQLEDLYRKLLVT